MYFDRVFPPLVLTLANSKYWTQRRSSTSIESLSFMIAMGTPSVAKSYTIPVLKVFESKHSLVDAVLYSLKVILPVYATPFFFAIRNADFLIDV